MPINWKPTTYHTLAVALLSLVIALIPCELFARQQVAFNHLSVRDGLSDVSAYAFQKDHLGYMWIGTQEGLNRYDGSNVVTYLHNPQSPSSLSENNIRVLFQDSKNRLWVGTNGGGLSQYLYEQDAFFNYLPKEKRLGKLQHGDIWDITEDNKGNLWIATGRGLHYFSPEIGLFELQMTLSEIRALAYDKERDKLWVGDYGKGLYYIEFKGDSTAQPFIVRDTWVRRALRRITHLVNDKAGLWVGTREYGLLYYRFATQKWTVLHKGNSWMPFNHIRGIAKDGDNTAWVGTDNGLVKVALSNGTPYVKTVYKSRSNQENSLAESIIRAVYNDNSGHLWIGTRTEGADRLFLKQKPFFDITKDDDKLPYNTVRSLLDWKQDSLWIGTDGGGLVLYDRKSEESVFLANKGILSDRRVCALYEDTRGRIWVGTRNGLALKMAAEMSFLTFRYEEKDTTTIPGPEIFAIAEDGQRKIWVSSSQGLGIFNEATQSFERIRRIGSNLPFDDISCLTFDKQADVLWMGTYGKGIIKCVPETMAFSFFPKGLKENGKLANALINCIHVGSDGFLWAGTFKDGIFRINPDTGEFFHYNMGNGLISNIIFAIQEDDSGHLWISTPKGLMKYELNREKWRSYDDLDGLPSSEFNYGTGAQSADGHIFLGGSDGVIYFHPDSIVDNTNPPSVSLTELTVLNRVVKPSPESPLQRAITVADEINLTYDQAFFSISYTSLSYAHKEDNSYAYRLEGLEEEWNEVDDREEAFYTNVPPGKYTFHVKASNSDGVWNEEGASINIIITPPIWRRAWFIGSAIALGAFLIWWFYKQRIKNIELSKQLLEKEVEKRTQEVVSQAEELALQAENLQKANELVQGQHQQLLDKQAETELAYSRIKMISNIGNELSGHLVIESLVGNMYEHLVNIMPIDGLGIGIYNSLLNRIEFKGFIEKGEVLPFHFDDMDNQSRLSTHALKSEQTLWINDAINEVPEITGQKIVEVSAGDMTNSVIYMPLIAEGDNLGVLTVQSFKRNAYTENDVDLLQALGVYVSVAVANILSFETIQQKNNQITDSIRYAQTIQQAILPFPEQLNKAFPEHFVYYRPKDIVSGDFYWLSQVPNSEDWLIAVADCTGHGVPGGFMSMIGSRLLSEAVQDKYLTEPAAILEYVDESIRRILQQESSKGNKDGMELGICYCHRTINGGLDINYAGAKMEMFYLLPGSEEVVEVHGTRREIGGIALKKQKPFVNKQIHLPPKTMLYISSDGLPDQNGADRPRLGKTGVKQLMVQQADMPIKEQGERIEQLINQLLKETHQRDDITVIGVRV